MRNGSGRLGASSNTRRTPRRRTPSSLSRKRSPGSPVRTKFLGWRRSRRARAWTTRRGTSSRKRSPPRAAAGSPPDERHLDLGRGGGRGGAQLGVAVGAALPHGADRVGERGVGRAAAQQGAEVVAARGEEARVEG